MLKYLNGIHEVGALKKGTWFQKGGKWIYITPTGRQIPQKLNGIWRQDSKGNWIYIPGSITKSESQLNGIWRQDSKGNWIYIPGSITKSESQMGDLKSLWQKITSGVTSAVSTVKTTIQSITIPKITIPNFNMPKFTNALAKIPLASGRGSFLLAVKTNYRGLADRLSQAYAKNPNAIKTKWNSYGGNWDSLKNAINAGNKVGAKIGEVDAETLNNIASALPIIASVLELIKNIKGSTPAEDQADQQAVDAMAYSIESGNANPNVSEDDKKFLGIDTKTLMLIAGGAGALYFLTKKK